MQEQKFCLFDFDNTIAKGDSIIPLLFYAVKKGFAKFSILPKALFSFLAYILNIMSDTAAKEKAVSFLKGKSVKEVAEFSEQYYNDKLRNKIFKDAREEIKNKKGQGYTVLIVTASPDFYLFPLVDDLNVDGIIATRTHVLSEGVYSGRLSGNNCRGIEKPLRIAEFLASKGLLLSKQESFAYGDSKNDAPMLALTDQPVIVNGSKKLIKLFPNAQMETWQ